jgi:ankyrin repeat protein
MDGRLVMKINSGHFRFLFLILLILSLPACPDPAQEARVKLEGMQVPYTEVAFVHRAARGDAAAVRLFLTAGMNPNVKDNQGITPLIAAAGAGREETVKLLLEKGADLNAQNPERVITKGKKRPKKITRYGGTPLIHAVRGGHTGTVLLLLDKGSDPNIMDDKQGLTALHWAVFRNQQAALQTLLDKGANPGVKDKRGFTPLVMAAHYAKPEIVSLLLDRIPAEEQDAVKKYLLFTAAGAGRADNVLLLLEKGAEVNARYENGLTPLMLAARAGRKDIVKLLLERGADAGARDQEGKKALDQAKPDDELMNLLFQAESNKPGPSKQ